MFSSLFKNVYRHLSSRFTEEIVIPTHHRLYSAALKEAMHQGGERITTRILTSDKDGARGPEDAKVLSYLPDSGEYVLRPSKLGLFGKLQIKRPVEDATQLDSIDQQQPLIIKAWCMWSPRRAIDVFMRSVQKRADSEAKEHIKVYRNGVLGYWRLYNLVPARKLDSVAMDPGKRETIKNHVGDFLNDRDDYIRMGVPWRYGMLLYWPPGTGKSSLTVAVASEFGLPIYNITFSSKDLSDNLLDQLFSSVPERSVLLLEDVDTTGVPRRSYSDMFERTVTLSGVLNALDGVNASQGRVLIMTTNHRERLNEALMRDGRADDKIEMWYVTPEIAAQMFKHGFRNQSRMQGFDGEPRRFGRMATADRTSPVSLHNYPFRSKDMEEATDFERIRDLWKTGISARSTSSRVRAKHRTI